MDDSEEKLVSQANQTQLLEDFRNARTQDYKIFILQECTVGLDSPWRWRRLHRVATMTVTNREIAAGRMTEDHSMRKIAVEGAAAPHLSHAELLAKHAKLEGERRRSPRPRLPHRRRSARNSRAYSGGTDHDARPYKD